MRAKGGERGHHHQWEVGTSAVLAAPFCAKDGLMPPVRVSDVGRPQPRTSHHDTTAATHRHYQPPYHRGTSREVAGGPAQAVDGTLSTAPVNVASTAGA